MWPTCYRPTAIGAESLVKLTNSFELQLTMYNPTFNILLTYLYRTFLQTQTSLIKPTTIPHTHKHTHTHHYIFTQ